MLPRRTRAPKIIEIGTGEPTYPVTARDYYRRIYFEAVDLMMNAIGQRLDQPSFDTYAKMESLLNRRSIRRTIRRAKVYGKAVQR